jgi:hypothetical protein
LAKMPIVRARSDGSGTITASVGSVVGLLMVT